MNAPVLQLEKRLVEGLENIAHVLKLPHGTDPRRLKRWIKQGMPAKRIGGAGPYCANREALLAWWSKFGPPSDVRLAEMVGDGR